MYFATQHCTRSPLFAAISTKRGHTTAKLNLVSLMDIFTILVFFLMVNSGDVEVLQPDESVILPKSYAKMRPDSAPLIKISGSDLIYRDASVVSLDAINSSDELIKPLYEVLMSAKKLAASTAKNKGANENSISVMGDANTPYDILKKVLYTCAQAGFRDVALAVEYSLSLIHI